MADFEALYRAEKDAVYAYACALAGQGAIADDLVHDAFMGVLGRMDELDRTQSMRAYLLTAVKRRFIDRVRRRGRDPGTIESEPEAKSAGDPSDRMMRTEFESTMRAAIASLGEPDAETVRLRVWGRLGFDEIGVIQKVPAATARTRYRTALERLRFKLEGAIRDERSIRRNTTA